MYDNINYYEIYCFFLSQIDCPFSTCTEAALSKFRPLTLNAYQSAKIREYDNCFSLCRKNTIFYISIVQSYATIFQCLVNSIIVGFFDFPKYNKHTSQRKLQPIAEIRNMDNFCYFFSSLTSSLLSFPQCDIISPLVSLV